MGRNLQIVRIVLTEEHVGILQGMECPSMLGATVHLNSQDNDAKLSRFSIQVCPPTLLQNQHNLKRKLKRIRLMKKDATLIRLVIAKRQENVETIQSVFLDHLSPKNLERQQKNHFLFTLLQPVSAALIVNVLQNLQV